MINLLLIIPNLGNGGAQKVFREQISFYTRYCNVVACVFNKDNLVEADLNLEIVSLEIPAGKNIVAKIFYFFLRVRKLRKLKRERKITISISHLEGADYVNILSRRNEKNFLWVHGTKKYDGEIGGVVGALRHHLLIPLFYRWADQVICVSHGIREELIQDYNLKPESVITLYNGFDILKIEEQAEDGRALLKEIKTTPLIVTHCRLAPQKNLGALILIFKKTIATTKAKLIFVGDGELYQELVSLTKSLGLKPYSIWDGDPLHSDYDVFFLGYQSNPYSLLADGDLYLMTSSWEGFPLALGEAMVCGIPVMAADCFTGPRELIAPDLTELQPISAPKETLYGILMPLADTEENLNSWAQQVCNLLQDETKRLSLATSALNHIQQFDQKEIQKRWLKIIE